MVKACYFLEGDSFLAAVAYDVIEKLREHGRSVTGRALGANPLPAIAPLVGAVCVELEPADPTTALTLFKSPS
jgi:hypothetical protein